MTPPAALLGDIYSFSELWRHYRNCRRTNPSIRASRTRDARQESRLP
jgi:hypothetical protein